MAELVTLTIDGRTVQAEKGTTVWQAAKDAGIFIPIYCYHPKMPPLGACRICLVEIEKMPKPMAGCTTTVTEGMVVKTASPMAEKSRAGVMEFLLINHPLDCPICDKGGECDLQNYAVEYGRGTGRFQEEKRHLGKAIELGPTIALDRERCIMCQRCVRFCHEIVQDEGLIIAQRGAEAQIDTYAGQPYVSQFSGNTVEICPVGALTARTYRFKARPWELRHTNSVCPHCAVGCNIEVDTRLGREVVRFMSRTNDGVDDGWLCDKGRYGYGFIQNEQRLRSPLIRKNGQLTQVTWPEALEYVTERLGEVKAKYGPEAVAAIAGSHSTNEEIYTFQKFARTVLGTSKITHRQGDFSGVAPHDLPKTLTATIAGIETAKVVVLVGAHISNRQPVMELRLKKAHQKGTKLVFIGGTPGSLTRFASTIIEASDDQLASVIQNLTSQISGEKYDDGNLGKAAKLIKEAATSAVWFDEDATLAAPELLANLVKLAETTGQLGQEGLGLGVLVGDNNSTGLRDIAALYDQSFSYTNFLKNAGGIKAAYIMGTNPQADILRYGGDPGLLLNLDLLIVHEMFLSETANLAEVVLPSASFAEVEGTFTNTEGRVQKVNPALQPLPGVAPDTAILLELANRLGAPLPRQSAEAIFLELANSLPAYHNLDYQTIGDTGVLRPLPPHQPLLENEPIPLAQGNWV